MIKVGITGNTGSELDLVCSMIEKYYDIPVFDADLALKFKLLFEQKTIESIAKRYDSTIYKNGCLDLEYFQTETSFEELITPVAMDVQKKFLNWRYDKHYNKPVVILKSIILYEFEFNKIMDQNISVYKPKSMRVNETRTEKFLPSTIVNKIFNSEMSDDIKNGKSDYIIQNYEPYTLSVKTLTEQVSSIVENLGKKAKISGLLKYKELSL